MAQERSMDLRQIEQMLTDSRMHRSLRDPPAQSLISNLNSDHVHLHSINLDLQPQQQQQRGEEEKQQQLQQQQQQKEEKQQPEADSDPAHALQTFLNRIPIASLPGINSSTGVLELKPECTVRDAIRKMYKSNVYGAPILDVVDPDTSTVRRSSDRYLGFVDLPTLVLWCLEEYEKDIAAGDHVDEGGDSYGFFGLLDQISHIGDTKVSELAKLFLWDPFLPAHFEDTLFHVLLLFSKHPVQVVPVVKGSEPEVIGFVTQTMVIQLLLQSSGLEWFDSIADEVLSEFRTENGAHFLHVHGDQTVADALQTLWSDRKSAVAVLDPGTKRLIGCVWSSGIYLLLENQDLFANRKNLTVDKFIHMESCNANVDAATEPELGLLISAATLHLKSNFLPHMDSPVTNKRTDTLKQAMKRLADTKCGLSFLTDENTQEVRGVVTSRDIIIQFAPPRIGPSTGSAGFFSLALEQSHCHVQGGTLVSDR